MCVGGGRADAGGAALEESGMACQLKTNLPSLAAGRSSQEVEGEEAPDYENLQIH